LKYWYDLEFIEDGRTIDIISIGIVSQDGREFYAQNEECRFRRASVWVQANVFPHLVEFDLKRKRPIISAYSAPSRRLVWQTRERIADHLRVFCDSERYGKPELWGYYAAYDHVALCQLFGTMMDLPKGWPMYTRDIKQWCKVLGDPELPEQGKGEHNALDDAKWNMRAFYFLAQLAQQRAQAHAC
jgi:hypothetical protein